MKQILEGVWNASPSAIIKPVQETAVVLVATYIIAAVLGIVTFWWQFRRFKKKHFSDPFFKD